MLDTYASLVTKGWVMDFLTIEELARRIEPSRTVLFFGAGSSIPSGAPSSEELVQILESKFELAGAGLNLMELASLIEGREVCLRYLRMTGRQFIRQITTS
jgi:hypothetical protein